MDMVFVKLFNMSMTAGWLILAVLILRLLLRKAPRWIHCLLWGFVAIRLICPVSFQSVHSLIPSTEMINLENIRYEEHPQIRSGVAAVNRVVNPVVENTFAPHVGDSVNPLAVWMYVAGVLWLIGAAVFLSFALVGYVRLRRQVRFAARLSEKVWQCDEIHVPFILGIFRPRIYVPSGIDDVSMGYVLAHEQAHLKRRDHWWKPLGYALLAVYWFHPLVWVAYVLFCRDIELACDERVIRSYDMDEKKAYSGALLAMSMNRRQAMVCPLAFGEVGVKERVKSVLNYKKPAFWLLVIAALACVAVAVCFLTDPKDEPICFQGQELDADRLSNETIEWLHWYHGLSEEDQLSVNFIPADVLDQLHLTAEDAETMDAAEDALRDKLQHATDEEIREFYYADLNHDGQKEAVAITSETVDEIGYSNAKVWYVSNQKCDLFGNSGDASIYPDSVRLYELSNTKMLCFTSGWGGSGSVAQAWVFDADGAKEVENVLEGISQLSENEFMVTSSAYDGATDGTGHTWNHYFSRWDGKKLVEYGGLEISEEQLKKAENADQILEDVKVYGEIQSIYYRGNGMVFINLSDGSLNRNVALKLADGTLKYSDYENPGTGAETDLEKATGDGIIYESVTSCVAYPDKFPLGGTEDVREKHVTVSYMLDEPDELPATLYEGDGFSIYVPDGWDMTDDIQVLEEFVRMRVTAPEAPEFSIWVACYEGKTAADVKARLGTEGYSPSEATHDEGFERMVKEEYPLWQDARLYPYGSDDTWVVFSRYDSAVEWGSRLDALADTLVVKGNS